MSRKHGATWWSGRFLRSLERLGMTTRLKRGHAYFEEGRVLDIEVEPGEVRSLVKGREEYECRIHFEPFSHLDWSESLERLAFQDLSAAALLTTGRMPPQIEDFFIPSGRRLLPQGESDLEFHCTCGDRAIPCKHMAATAYALAEKLDMDPWLLFLLRGKSAQEVESELLERWNIGLDTDETEAPLSNEDGQVAVDLSQMSIDVFWASELTAPILFPNESDHTSGLTLERMALPEPKLDQEAWNATLGEVYEEVSRRAEERLD